MNVVTQLTLARDNDHDVRLQAMFDASAIGIAICQLNGRMIEANPALSKMFGYSQHELTSTQAEGLYPGLHGVHKHDASHNDEREIPQELISPGEPLLRELVQGERSSFDMQKLYQRKDGSALWGHLTVSLGLDARRRAAFLIAMLTDATERKRIEEHLHEAEKMEVIGRLAGGIAHDFNNLLTGILLYCDLLSAGLERNENVNENEDKLERSGAQREDLAQPKSERSELCRHVNEVREAGEQGAALTRQLLAIARKQAAEPRLIRLNDIVTSTKNLLRRLIGEQINLVILLDPALDAEPDSVADSGAGLVLADPTQLRQILLNLVLNARDAMPRGGTITLSTRVAEFPGEIRHQTFAEPALDHTESRNPLRAIALAVADNGSGMDAETRARLFEPFFTTKNPGEGTGLGLATVQRIVGEAGGRIEVTSTAGHGSCIEVFFPVVESSIAEPASSSRAQEAAH
jgi:two-component system cell cycle sensor histidine kinase/response regulator CckA